MLATIFPTAARAVVIGAHIFALGALLAITSAGAHDGDKHRKTQDHDTALSALSRGEIVRLEIVLAAVKTAVPGEVVGVELRRRQGNWLYELKVLSPEGVAMHVLVDARTGQVLDAKTKSKQQTEE